MAHFSRYCPDTLPLRLVIAACLIAVLAALSLLHLYWAFGGGRGRLAAVPANNGEPLFTPSLSSTVMVAAALALAAAIAAAAAGWLDLPVPLRASRALTLLIGLVFLLRAVGDFRYVGFFKRRGDGPFRTWDSRLYSPLCLGIAAAAFLIALSAG